MDGADEMDGMGSEKGDMDGAMDDDLDDDDEDPLTGLEERLKSVNLDEESKNLIKTKLEEISGKIRGNLDDRQKVLEDKISAPVAPAKKK
jgi:hypothetical protein